MTRLMIAFCAAMLAATPPTRAAEAWPSRAVRIVVPYPAGGATDFVARTVAERLAKSIGQPVVVDNKPGAAGAIGAAEAARAAPDGHTLLMTITDTQVNNAALYRRLAYDPRADFIGVTQIVRSPALVSTHPGTGIGRLAELKAKAAQGARLSFGSWGIGSLGHLAGETLNRSLGAGMVHVPHRGEGPVVTDLLSGTIDIGLSSVASAMQHVQGGRIVPLAVLGRQRSTSLPQVPTLRELGFDDPLYDSNVWIGLLAPARTPQPVVEQLAREIRAIVGQPEIGRLFVGRGFELLNTTPAQFAEGYFIEFDIVTRRIRELGLQAE